MALTNWDCVFQFSYIALNGIEREQKNNMGESIQVIDAVHSQEIPIVDGVGNAKVVIWPGMGARCRTFQMIVLGDNSKTMRLRHPTSDAAYYVIKGQGRIVDVGTGHSQELDEGGMVHIDANDQYQFVAGASGMELLGGPCPADASLYASLKS
jgi:mannose-6-phosphate isomerase-like protein (cupin superfamily)